MKQSQNLTGIIGHPISHSLSPIMHNAAFKALGLDYTYQTFDVLPENLEKTMQKFRCNKNIKGLNVTVPHKISVMKYLDNVSKEAKLIGAVNTIVFKDNQIYGYNTDAQGFIISLKKEIIKIKNKKFFILGAGGAARAVAFGLAMQSVKQIFVFNRTQSRAKELVNDIKKNFPNINIQVVELKKEIVHKADILINTTSLGLKGEKSLVPYDWLIKDQHVCVDLIYHQKTDFLQQAQKAGCAAISGIGMLIMQGALAFKLWTGHDAPVSVMEQALKGKI